jgi:hypothetical protein
MVGAQMDREGAVKMLLFAFGRHLGDFFETL